MDFLVTGGAGFIGSAIVRRLCQNGFSVRVLDNLSTGNISNLDDYIGKIEMIEGDILDNHTVKKALDGVKYVFHLAALPSINRSIENPIESNRVNIEGTLNLLVAAKEQKTERFVFSSSSSVYGSNPLLPRSEDTLPQPISPYAIQKFASELYCKIFFELYGLKTFILRYFNVYGPRQNPHGPYAAVIPKFITGIKNGERPIIYGDGRQTRDFTFVEDVVDANILCCSAPPSEAGKVFNIAGGSNVSIIELYGLICKIMGKKDILPLFAEPRKGEVRDSLASIEKAQTCLNWKPYTSLESGLAQTVAFFANK